MTTVDEEYSWANDANKHDGHAKRFSIKCKELREAYASCNNCKKVSTSTDSFEFCSMFNERPASNVCYYWVLRK